MTLKIVTMETKSWKKEQIVALIDAYKAEACLYAIRHRNYHNKNLRAAALRRVSAAVSTLRPGVTEKECAIKFHNLRSQFNVENSKVKISIKCEPGAEEADVYQPSLWYFDRMKFLEEHTIPRKRTSLLQRQSRSSDVSKKRKLPQNDNANACTGAIEPIAESPRAPITVSAIIPPPASSTDPVDACMTFLGTVLKGFSSEELKIEVMNNLVQTVLNAKTSDLERNGRDCIL